MANLHSLHLMQKSSEHRISFRNRVLIEKPSPKPDDGTRICDRIRRGARHVFLPYGDTFGQSALSALANYTSLFLIIESVRVKCVLSPKTSVLINDTLYNFSYQDARQMQTAGVVILLGMAAIYMTVGVSRSMDYLKFRNGQAREIANKNP